ncbi:MAG: branched-chain-amino-acid transaminase [Verrucomicrobiota bacterium]|nr:branched-chain-amino-acid transaminase [Verrucomicrobiota bacterium]
MKVYINGVFYPKDEAKISVFDHGLLYGDGIFEGIRLYKKCIFRLDEHLERLEYSAKALMLSLPWTRQQISDATCAACRENNLTDGYIRLIVTRGAGTLGLDPFTCKDPQLIIIADSISLYPEEFYTKGLKVITAPTRRVNPAALPPMVKSLNYLNSTLAKIEAINLGYMEAIMLNDQGYIAECTGDNIFIIHKGTLLTTPVSASNLKGVTRGVVLDIAKGMGIPVLETNLTRYDVWIADECFLTGTAAEVIPVVEVDGRTIGHGNPGPITARFLHAFHQRVSEDGTML